MTAADKKIILEHGSDYVLRLKIKADDGINNRDMSNWTWKFDIYNSTGVKLTTPVIDGTFPDNEDTVNGDVTILIDSAVIGQIPPLVTGDDAFATQYNYYHTLTVTEPGTGTVGVRAMRLLRGKLAVRL